MKRTTYSDIARTLEALPGVLRTTREARGISLRDAADEVGISHNTLYRLECGHSVTLKSYAAILRWLDAQGKAA